MKGVVKMANTKSYVYEQEMREFKKAQREQRESRKNQRSAKRNYNDGE